MKINYSHTRFNKSKFQKHKRSQQRNTDSHQVCVCAVAQLCPTLCDPMDVAVRLLCSRDSPDRILEWISILFSRGSPWPRDRTQVSYTAGGFFSVWATREVPSLETNNTNLLVNLLHSKSGWYSSLSKKREYWLGRSTRGGSGVMEMFYFFLK